MLAAMSHSASDRKTWRRLACSLLVAAVTAGTAAPALADKPDWAGGGKGGKHERGGHRDDRRDDDHGHHGDRDLRPGRYFSGHDREVVWSIYGPQVEGGRACPPGLARKNNGCLPPGQAKKYAIGQPLPAGVVYYPVPQPVVMQLPPVPAGYRYVRVAADILLIAVGTSMVVDAISDLGRL